MVRRPSLLLVGVAALACSTFAFRGMPEPAPATRLECALAALVGPDEVAPASPAPRLPTAPVTVVSEAGLQMIREFEGFTASPRWDRTQWSIGYGSRSETQYGVITETEASERLRAEAGRLSRRITEASRVPLTQAQLDALTSFAYNVGAAALLGHGARLPSTLWQRIQAGDMAGAGREFLRWNRTGGRESKGLTKRREREASLFRGGLQ